MEDRYGVLDLDNEFDGSMLKGSYQIPLTR
jgi:hypothetical protein